MAVKKIHELTNEALTANDDDFFVIDVDNGDGSYTTKKIKKSNIPTGAPTGANTSQIAKTGQTTSYATGDDGDEQRGRDFFKLDEPNHFGHTWRFTGITGSYFDIDTLQYKNADGSVIGTGAVARSTAFPNYILLDHSTLQPNGNLNGYYLTSSWTGEANLSFTTAQTFASGLTVDTFTGWSVCNIRELIDTFFWWDVKMFPPLLDTLTTSGTTYVVSDTTATYDTGLNYYIRLDAKLMNTWDKTSTNPIVTRIFVRTFNTSEL